MTPETAMPEGFRKDRSGNLIAEDNIRPQELIEDQLVRDIAADATAQNAALSAMKGKWFRDIIALKAIMEERYGVKRGGQKGNLTLYTFDGAFRVDFQHADRIDFGPDLDAARALIGEYLDAVTSDASSELRSLVTRAFRVEDHKARVADVLALLRWEIRHPKWEAAMEAVRNSIRVIDRASYVRVYRRDAVSGVYHPIPLDLAKIAIAEAEQTTAQE